MIFLKKAEIRALIQSRAKDLNLDSKLLEAIVLVESNYNPTVVRFEEGWPYLEDPKKYASYNRISHATEMVLQRMSWGLGQIMGGAVRSLGYAGPLTTLIDPENNVYWFSLFFKIRCDKYERLEDKIAAYNAGTPRKKDGVYTNQGYVDKVLKALATLETDT